MLLLIADAAGTLAALGIPTTTSDPQELHEGTLNRWSYLVLQSGMALDGMLMFLRNIKEYPQSSNVYDSLGEAYRRAGKNLWPSRTTKSRCNSISKTRTEAQLSSAILKRAKS
jgi:hypothetical protein